MRRRDPLGVLGGAAGFAAGGSAAPRQETAVSRTTLNYASVPAVYPGDAEAYFGEEKLRALVDLTKPLPKAKYEVVAYNYPCWHPCSWFQKYFGEGWTQFQSLRDARPLYPGHLFPKYPLWGEYDEADPEWAEQEIEPAARYGIDVWMICWYRQEGTQRCQAQLEQGFLKARNRERLKFALMWANHDWSNHRPGTSEGKTALMPRRRHTEEDMIRAMDYCIEHYFHHPNYWRIGGELVFGIYSVESLLRDLSADGWKRIAAGMRKRVLKAGLGGLHLQAGSVRTANAGKLHELGFQGGTLYHTPTPLLSGVPSAGGAPYRKVAAQAIPYRRKLRSQCAAPFFPCCSVGWDDSPRVGRSARRVTQRSPDQFERLMLAAKHFLAEAETVPKIVFLSSRNEWTEDHVCRPVRFTVKATWKPWAGCSTRDNDVPQRGRRPESLHGHSVIM